MNTLIVLDTVFTVLTAGTAVEAISGKLFKTTRPPSEKEDIVINTLPINNESIQECTFNVNVYVPDLKITYEGKAIFVPNHKRLSELCAMAIADIECKHSTTYYIYVENQSIQEELEIRQHYVNVRAKFITHKS